MRAFPVGKSLVLIVSCFALCLPSPSAAGVEGPPPSEGRQSATAPSEVSEPAIDPGLFSAMEYRSIGPLRGGRSTTVTGIADEPDTYYMGTTGGGVWKTTDSGLTWDNISDGFFDVASIGAIDIADSDPNVIYVGTGSACPRGNVSIGRGVYKSTDAGRTR